MFITIWRAVKRNQIDKQRKARMIPVRMPTVHLKMIVGFGFLDGGLDRKDMGSIFIGMSANVTP